MGFLTAEPYLVFVPTTRCLRIVLAGLAVVQLWGGRGAAAQTDTLRLIPRYSEMEWMLTAAEGTYVADGSIAGLEGWALWEMPAAAPEALQFVAHTATLRSNDRKMERLLKSEEFFWPERYPEMRFVLNSAKHIRKDHWEMNGSLQMRGTQQRFNFPATLERGKQYIQLNARLSVDRTAFGSTFGSNSARGIGKDVAISDIIFFDIRLRYIQPLDTSEE